MTRMTPTPIAADEKYKGKTVQLESVVRSTDTDGAGTYVDTHNFRCYFDDNHKGALAKLSEGQIIGVRGIFRRDEDRGKRMEKCELVEPKPVSYELSASRFYQEWREDPGLFEARYKGKTLKITGKVQYNRAIGVAPSTIVGLDSGPDHPLTCRFDEKHWPELKKISTGQDITVRSSCSRIFRDFYPELDKCELVN